MFFLSLFPLFFSISMINIHVNKKKKRVIISFFLENKFRETQILPNF